MLTSVVGQNMSCVMPDPGRDGVLKHRASNDSRGHEYNQPATEKYPIPTLSSLTHTTPREEKTEIKKPQLLIWKTGGQIALQLETHLFRGHTQIFIL